MERFFHKHASCLSEKHALEIIHEKIHEAKEELAEDEDWMKPLCDAHTMIEDLLSIKGTPPSVYKVKLMS